VNAGRFDRLEEAGGKPDGDDVADPVAPPHAGFEPDQPRLIERGGVEVRHQPLLGLAFAAEGEGTIPALPIEVVSTHGAGDMFVGSLAADLARGVSFARALDQANRAAAALVAGTFQTPL